MNVLLLTKTTPVCDEAVAIVKKKHPTCGVLRGCPGDPWPFEEKAYRHNLLISFLSPWIVPKLFLHTQGRAVNFHPAPPSHPGFAPYSWAIYQNERHYGVTVHEMVASVDTGRIVRTAAVPIFPTDTVFDLQQRTYLQLLMELRAFVNNPGEQKDGLYGMNWRSPARTKADFERLRLVPKSCSAEEFLRRQRACAYPGQPGAEWAS